MNQLNRWDYYLGRAAISRELARRASDPVIAVVHSDFAIRYELLASEAKPKHDEIGSTVQAT